MLKRYLEIGKIVNTHGIKGDLKIEPWCNSSDFLCSFNELYLHEGRNKISIKYSRPHKNVVIMHLEGVDTIDTAEKLKGMIIYADRNDIELDENEYFIQDIIGCEVSDFYMPKIYGIVTDVFKTGANDVYEVTNEKNVKCLVPVIDDVIRKTDIENRQIKITPLEGIFDDAD